MICPGDFQQRNSNAPKFEDRSQEETEWQERCAREAAWKLAKKYPKIKGETKKHSSHLRKIDPQTRRNKIGCWLRSVDAHDQKKEMNSAELETVTTSRSPTTVLTANGEVQTHEEATVSVKELDIILTMKVLEDTPEVFVKKALRRTRILIRVDQRS